MAATIIAYVYRFDGSSSIDERSAKRRESANPIRHPRNLLNLRIDGYVRAGWRSSRASKRATTSRICRIRSKRSRCASGSFATSTSAML